MLALGPSPYDTFRCGGEIALQSRQQRAFATAISHFVQSHHVDTSTLGLAYARAGNIHEAMKLFERSLEEKDIDLMFIRYDAKTPRALLADPRWEALWQRPGLREWQIEHDRLAEELNTDRSGP